MYKVLNIKRPLLLTTSYLLLVAFCLLLAAPLALAAPPPPPDLHLQPKCNPTLAPSPEAAAKQVQELKAKGLWKDGDLENPCDLNAFVGFVQNLIEFMFYISIPIAVMFIIYGSFVIMTAGGSEERFKNGKKVITAAIVGIIIVFSSNLIITTIEKALKSGAEQILK
ncbi:MAG: pilin [Patescibacteria group bacterium]